VLNNRSHSVSADDVPGEDTIEQLKHRCQQLEAENKNVKATLAAIDGMFSLLFRILTVSCCDDIRNTVCTVSGLFLPI